MAETYASFATKHLDVRTRSGAEWMCLCPYHEDSNPSFAINVRKGLFVCYACGVKGKVDSLAQHLKVSANIGAVENTVDDVKKKVAEYNKPDAGIRSVPDAMVSFWEQHPDRNSLWAKRRLMGSKLDLFRLGYDAMEDALTIPVHHPTHDRVVSVIRRRLNPTEGQPKYHYERGFKISEHLYGSWQVRQLEKRPNIVAITEGSIDTLCMWQIGTPSVALLGARVSETQAKLLRELDPVAYVILTDNDDAGRAAKERVTTALSQSGIMLMEPTLETNYKDPAEMPERVRFEMLASAKRLVKVSS